MKSLSLTDNDNIEMDDFNGEVSFRTSVDIDDFVAKWFFDIHFSGLYIVPNEPSHERCNIVGVDEL